MWDSEQTRTLIRLTVMRMLECEPTFEIESMRAASITSQGSEFHEFLYAPIGGEQEGMTLSVLSALARQDLDPWAEASRLSQLPEKTAAKQILDWLDALPHRTLAGLDRAEVAGRLSALLPRGATTPNLAAKPRPASTKVAHVPAAVVAFNWRFLFLYFCLMLLMNWLMAVSHAPPPAAATSDSTGAAGRASDTPPASSSPGTDARNPEEHHD